MNSTSSSIFPDGFSTLSTEKPQLAGAFSGSLKSDIQGLRRISSLFEDETLLGLSRQSGMQGREDVIENPGRESSSRALAIFFCLVLSVSGIVLFALGIVILFDMKRTQMQRLVLLSLNNATPVVPILYYISLAIPAGGFLIFMTGSWTLLALIKRSPFMVIISLTLLALLLLAQISLACISVAYQIGMTRNLKTELLSRLYSNYNMPQGIYFTSAMDYIQTQYSCCGLTGDFDYQKSQWHHQHLGGMGLSVPRSCCALTNKVDVKSFLNPEVKDLNKCNKSGESNSDLSELKYFRHIRGCLDVIVDWARLEFLLIIGSSLGIGLLEVLGITILIHYTRVVRGSKESKEIISLTPSPFPLIQRKL